WSQEEIIRRAGRLPLDKPFRGAFQYQSTMFTAAGKAVAVAAGVSWEEFLRAQLLRPLGMSSVAFTTHDACRTRHYAYPLRLNRRGEQEVMDFYPIDTADPAGALHCCARDLTRWLMFQLGDGSAGGVRVVSSKNLAETHSSQIELPIDASDRQMFPGLQHM